MCVRSLFFFVQSRAALTSCENSSFQLNSKCFFLGMKVERKAARPNSAYFSLSSSVEVKSFIRMKGRAGKQKINNCQIRFSQFSRAIFGSLRSVPFSFQRGRRTTEERGFFVFFFPFHSSVSLHLLFALSRLEPEHKPNLKC